MARIAGHRRVRQAVGARRLRRARRREAKIAALGLKVRNGCTYHGLAVNVDMDLAPFADIDPCGYPGLAVTQLADVRTSRRTVAEAGDELAPILAARLARRAEHGHFRPLSAAANAAGVKHKGGAKTARIPIKIVAAETLRKPDWIRVRAPSSPRFYEIKQILREHNLHTVCEEASCPNIGECFGKGTATFMIMGDICTRRCPFCDVGHGRPLPLDADEPVNLAKTIAALELQLRRHHERRPRRPARRRRAALRRLHPRGARALAGDADRSAGARFPRPAGARARHPDRRRRPT